MADTPQAQDAAGSYLDAVKWMVGLSGAVVAGVFLHPELITQWPRWGRVYVAFVLSLFGVSIFSGVVYLLWITRARRRKEQIAEIDRELTGPAIISTARVEELRKQKEDLGEEEMESKKWLPRWFKIFTGSFYLGAILGLIFFSVQIALASKSKDEDKDKYGKSVCNTQVTVPEHPRFAVVQSAVHRTQHGMQAHTFLLDQQTGEVWQMICDQKGQVVVFERVKKEDLRGNLDTEGEKKP